MVDFEKYEFAGNWPSSLAKVYKQREYTHSRTVKGKEVKYFDCYRIREDFVRPLFEEENKLDKAKTKRIEDALGIKFNKNNE